VLIPAMVVATSAKDRIAIVDKISPRLGLRKSSAQWLCGPGRRRMFSDRHVNDSSTVVREDAEHEEESEGNRRHDEESCHDLAGVIVRNVRQVVTVDADAVAFTSRRSIDSLRFQLLSSPWIRGAPQRRFAVDRFCFRHAR
jgi:hypothetical protein